MKKFSISTELYEQHRQLTRRYFMKLGITSPFIFKSTRSDGDGATLNPDENQIEKITAIISAIHNELQKQQ